LPRLALIQKGMKFARPCLSLPMGVPMSKRKQQGFTLIEIAIVLVIIGLLLGGILQGQSLINSARVRNLISQEDGIKAAFYGFQDRYRALPGDFSQASVLIPNVLAASNGDGNGQITGTEAIAVWDHLSHAGFITGTYIYNAIESSTTTPANPWNAYIQLIYDAVYADPGAATSRHNLKIGNQVPVEVIAEVDRKVDDGNALRGAMRFSAYADGGVAPVAANCYDTAAGVNLGLWSAGNGQANCGAAFLF
jgi:prepilin-type N-terminal cleavage/methylation domain-containing protein